MVEPHRVSVDTLRAIADAFNAHDLDAIMGFFSDDCSFDMPRGGEPWGRRLSGKAAVRGPQKEISGRPGAHTQRVPGASPNPTTA